MNKEKYYYKKEISMSVTVIVLITIFIKILINNKFINGFSDEIGDNQVVAALTQDDKIRQPEYFEFKFISKEQFLKYQIGNIKEQIIYCSTMNNFYNEPSTVKELNRMETKIPKPAIKKCISATLIVLLGNAYGKSFDAIEPTEDILQKLSQSDRISIISSNVYLTMKKFFKFFFGRCAYRMLV